MTLIMAATKWNTNAELIEDIVRLGYIKPDDVVLDPTYGRGTWWKNYYHGGEFVANDLAQDGWDFRDAPYADEQFDVVAFDPPYICVGGLKTTTVPDFNDRYGLHSAPRTPLELQFYINSGILEMRRVLKRRGILLVKCCDYVSSGKLFPGSHHTLTFALDKGFTLIDRLYHLRNPGPQSQTTQVHARQNLSTLLVLKK